jgi:WD40 repeat protein
VRVWNTGTGTQQVLLSQKFSNLDQVHFDPSGKRLLILDQHDPATVWDVASNQQRAELKADGVAQESGAFSPDGKLAFTGGSDRQVRAWNADSGQLVFILGSFVDKLSLLEFSPDGKILALYAGGGTVFFYDTNTGKAICQWDTPSRAPVSSIRFWPGSHFAAVTVFQSLYFFDPDASQLLATYQGEGSLANIHFTPDGTRVLVSQGKSARIIPLFHPLKDANAAAQVVDQLDRWKLVNGRLVAK